MGKFLCFWALWEARGGVHVILFCCCFNNICPFCGVIGTMNLVTIRPPTPATHDICFLVTRTAQIHVPSDRRTGDAVALILGVP